MANTSALPLPSCFLPSVAKFFGLSTGKRIDLPVALAPAVAEFALPLPSCFPTSSTAIFVFGGGDGFCRRGPVHHGVGVGISAGRVQTVARCKPRHPSPSAREF